MGIEIVDGDLPTQVRAIATMLVDGKVMHGMAQEGLFIGDRNVPTIDMEAEHGLLDQVLGVFLRSPLAPQELQQAIKMRRTRCHGSCFRRFKRYGRLPVWRQQKRGSL